MEKLKSEFTLRGFSCRLLQRNDFKAIYSQEDGYGHIWYEVIRIRVMPSGFHRHFGVSLKEREVYPSDGQWGVCGWTFKRLVDAQRKYGGLKSRTRKNKS